MGIEWDQSSAHSAAYDAERTADIFCRICNDMHGSFLRAEERARPLGWARCSPGPLDLISLEEVSDRSV